MVNMELVPDQPDSPIANPKDQACSEEESKVWDLLADVLDPEVPALSVVDLGIIRKVTVDDAGFVTVAVTPTYTGCPATDMINAIIKAALHDGGTIRIF